jgi:HEAT repeat protein
VWVLARVGEPAAPHLGDLLKDSDANIRLTAVQVLQNMGPKAAKAVPALREAIKDANPQVRLHAMLALVATGSEGAEFLVKQFNEQKEADIRANIIQRLAYSTNRKHAVPLLKIAMKDSSTQVRQTTVNLIGHFGQDSKEGFEVFLMGLKDSDSQVRITAGHHGNFFGQKSWQPFEEALKSTKDSGFRQAMLQSLQATSYRSKKSVAPLIECLKDGNVTVRILACNILGNIGRDADAALPPLRELAKDGSNQAVQNAASNAVRRIEAKDK